MSSNVVRPAAFQERAEDLLRKERYEGYLAARETSQARRVIEMLREESLLVAIPVPVAPTANEGTTP